MDSNQNAHMQRRREEIELRREEKSMKKKSRKKLLLLLLLLVVFLFYDNWIHFDFHFNFNFFENKSKKDSSSSTLKSDLDGNFIAYVPIDDRPIHTTHISLLAESLGYELKTPDTKFIKTYLGSGENSYPDFTTKYGNPLKIASWLLELEEDGCNYYIISLDQLFSGGIVGSTYLSDDDLNVYGKSISNAKKVFEKILEDKKNHVYLIDSVMGFTTEDQFMDITTSDVGLLNTYTRTIPRKTLSGEDLNIDSIAANYEVDQDGNSIATELDITKLGKFLAARKRKLTYMEYVISEISKSSNKNIHLYYGVEDASSEANTIQENEILYLKKLLSDKVVDAVIYDNSSSLTEFAFSDMILDAIETRMSVKTIYYGNKDQTISSSGESYEEYLDRIYKDLDIYSDQDEIDFQVLVNTKAFTVEDANKQAKELINQYLSNISKHIPTIIINDADYYSDKVLINELTDYSTYQVPLGYLIGYSNWGKFEDSARLSLSQGISRILALSNSKNQDKKDKAFVKVMAHAFIEDMAYLPSSKMSTDLRVVENELDATTKVIQKNLTSGNFISSLSPYQEKGVTSIDTHNYAFPWSRPTELSFDVSVTLDKAKKIDIPKKLEEKTDEEKEEKK